MENTTTPFIYLGKVNTIKDSVQGNCPISMNFSLEMEVPQDLYNELTTIVKEE